MFVVSSEGLILGFELVKFLTVFYEFRDIFLILGIISYIG